MSIVLCKKRYPIFRFKSVIIFIRKMFTCFGDVLIINTNDFYLHCLKNLDHILVLSLCCFCSINGG